MIWDRTEFYQYEHQGRLIHGRRAILIVETMSWPGIENWGVLTRLESGMRYQCEMGMWHGTHGQTAKAIRVLLTTEQFEFIYPESRRIELVKEYGEEVARGRIYLPHPANYAHQLQGCGTIGMAVQPLGVWRSEVAIEELFDYFGGWEEGKRIELEVRG